MHPFNSWCLRILKKNLEGVQKEMTDTVYEHFPRASSVSIFVSLDIWSLMFFLVF